MSLRQDPTHHLVLENEYARVFRVELPSGAATKLHKHDHDYVSVILTDAEMQGFAPGKPREAIHRVKGQIRYTEAGLAHGNINSGKTTFRCLVVELLKEPAGESADPQREGAHTLDLGHGHIEDVVLNKPRVQVTDLQIAPGAQSDPGAQNDEEADGGPRLLVWMAAGELMAGRGMLQGKEGEVSWLAADAPGSLHNMGTKAAHVMVVQFK